METRCKKYTRDHDSLELIPQRSLQGRGEKKGGENRTSHRVNLAPIRLILNRPLNYKPPAYGPNGISFCCRYLREQSQIVKKPSKSVFLTALPYFTTIVVLRSVFPAELDPRTVKAYEPAVVGLPVIAAVEAFRLSPGGRLPDTIENDGAG